MADDNQVNVKIVGDASQVAPAVEQTKDEIGGLTAAVQQMSTQFAELAAAITGSMQTGAATTAEMAGEMKTLIAETEKESLSLKSLAVSAKEGLASFAEMRESLMGIGELLMAAFAVEEIAHFAESIGDAAEKTLHLSQQLGLSIGQTQSLAAAAAATGVPFDALTRGLGQLDLKLEKNPKLFSDLGIQIPKNADQMTVLNAVMDHFNGMADGPNKTAEAMALMGRAGKELIPFLNEGADGLAALVEKAKEYGAVNTDAAAKGVVLAESLNEGKLAMDGLKLTLSDAFAPLLTEVVDGFNNLVKSMTESYNTGGAVKVAFEAIVEVFQGLGEIIAAIGAGFSEMFSGTGASALDWAAVIKAVIDAVVVTCKVLIAIIVSLVSGLKIGFEEMIGYALEWSASIKEFFDNVGVAIDKLEAEFQLLSIVVQEAMSFNWSGAAADWDAGMAQIDAVVKARGAQIVADAKSIHDQATAWLTGANKDQGQLDNYLAHVGDTAKPASTGIKLPKTGNDSGGDLSTAGKKGKKEKDDLVQQLEAELTAKKLAWDEAQDAQNTAQQFSLASEKAFWADALSQTDLSGKDRAAVERKYLDASAKLRAQQITGQLDIYKQEEAAAGKNADAKLAIVAKETDFIGREYGLQSDQYKAALAKQAEAAKAAEEQKLQVAKVTADGIDKLQQMRVAQEEADDKFLVEMGRMTQAQQLANEKLHQNELYQTLMQGLQQRLALMKKDPNYDPVAYKQLTNEIEQAELAHQSKLTQIDQQAALQRKQIAQQMFQPFSAELGKMLTAQETFAAGFKNMWQSLGNVVAAAVSHMVEAFLEGLITQDVASGALHAKEMLRHAEEAAAGAWKAVVGIPIVGPILAPIAAATAFAGVMAFSAEGGMDRVPYDGATIVAHKDEMVLSAQYANPLRDLLSGGGFGLPAGMSSPFASMLGAPANNNAPAAANDGGGGHTFNGPVIMGDLHAIDTQSGAQFLMRNSRHVAAAGDAGVRAGYQPKNGK